MTVERGDQSWAAQRFKARSDILAADMPLDVIATVDVSKFSQSVHRLLHWMLVVLVLLGGIAAAIGTRIAGKMVSSLGKLIDAFRKLAQNEYVHVVPVKTHDELEMLTSGFNQMVDGLIERDHLRTTFGKYLTEAVVAHLLSGKVALGGETIQVTVLFSDIRSFTTMSETMAIGVDILISETTYEQAKEFVTARPVEQLSVKGRAEPVKAYEVIVSQSSLSVPPGLT